MSKPEFGIGDPGEVSPAQFDQLQAEAIRAIRESKGFVVVSMNLKDDEIGMEVLTGFFFAAYESQIAAILDYYVGNFEDAASKVITGLHEFIERTENAE